MTEDKIIELADFHLGPGKYNTGRVIAFAKACEREGMNIAARLARAALPQNNTTEQKEK